MTTTAFITITDTGKRRTSSSSAEESDIVNSGAALTLYGVEVTLDEKAILNVQPSMYKLSDTADATSEFTHGEVDVNGVEQPKWTIRGVLNFKNATDRTRVQLLRQLARTKGYKQLGGDLADMIDGNINSSKVNVHIESVKIIHRSENSIISYQITAFETA